MGECKAQEARVLQFTSSGSHQHLHRVFMLERKKCIWRVRLLSSSCRWLTPVKWNFHRSPDFPHFYFHLPTDLSTPQPSGSYFPSLQIQKAHFLLSSFLSKVLWVKNPRPFQISSLRASASNLNTQLRLLLQPHPGNLLANLIPHRLSLGQTPSPNPYQSTQHCTHVWLLVPGSLLLTSNIKEEDELTLWEPCFYLLSHFVGLEWYPYGHFENLSGSGLTGYQMMLIRSALPQRAADAKACT